MIEFLENHWVIIVGLLTAGAFVVRVYEEHKGLSKKVGDSESNIEGIEAALRAHEKECNETPKAVVLERLDNLCTRLDDMKATGERNYIELGVKVEVIRVEARENNRLVHARIDSLFQEKRGGGV